MKDYGGFASTRIYVSVLVNRFTKDILQSNKLCNLVSRNNFENAIILAQEVLDEPDLINNFTDKVD